MLDKFNLPKLNGKLDDEPISTVPEKQKQDTYKDLEAKLKKIQEIRIYLRQNFQKSDLDDVFIKKLELEYASQYLDKINLQSTKYNINKVLKLKPFDLCDFQLTIDQIRGKNVKALHIFPNNNENNKKGGGLNGLKATISNEEFEAVMNNTALVSRETQEDKINSIKNRPLKQEEIHLFLPETVEKLIKKAKEDIDDKRLYLESHGLIEQNKGFDLEIGKIREKYLNPKTTLISDGREYANAKAKFQNIEKATKRDIIKSENFEFPFLDINLNKDLLKEVNKPMEIPVEVIVKDINYILDNFPIDQLINVDDQKSNDNKDYGSTMSTMGIGTKSTAFESRTDKFYKIKSITKADILYVYQRIQSSPVYRIIGLLVNLIYWMIFGYINRIQIDKYSKQQLLFKILEELNTIELSFKNQKKYHKIFMPILILILRIECEAIFTKKFKVFFEDKINEQKAFSKINELITTIFDPNCYFNTFTFLGTDVTKLKHTINKNLLPNYKKKINATSTMVNQLFTTFKNEKNLKQFMGTHDFSKNPKTASNFDDMSKNLIFKILDWEDEFKYIVDGKAEFYRTLLNKINQNLKKRNLDPIFKITKNTSLKEA